MLPAPKANAGEDKKAKTRIAEMVKLKDGMREDMMAYD